MNTIAEADYVRGGTQKAFYGIDDVEKCNCPVCGEANNDHICHERGAIWMEESRIEKFILLPWKAGELFWNKSEICS